MAEAGTAPTAASRPVVVRVPAPSPSPEQAADLDVTPELLDPRIDHTVTLHERGPFTVAVCAGCGWESFARRSRPLARREGRDHEVLFDTI